MIPYDAFETQEGACLDQVEYLCHHLTNSGQFTGQHGVEQPDVESMISSTYYQMVVMMANYGYSAAQTDSTILGILQFYNALGTSAKVELAFSTNGFNERENTRHSFIWNRFMTEFDKLLAGRGLCALGAVMLADGFTGLSDGLSAGGISLSDKETISKDTDATKYAFTRKLMDNPQSPVIISDETTVTELP